MSESRFADEGTLAYIAQLEAECGKVPEAMLQYVRSYWNPHKGLTATQLAHNDTISDLIEGLEKIMLAPAPQPALKATPLDLMECLTDRPIEPSKAVQGKCVVQAEQQEPAAWAWFSPEGALMYTGSSKIFISYLGTVHDCVPLYTAPPDQSAENERLRQVCRDTYEVWAGSGGVPLPKTCGEAYVLQLLEQMRDEVKKGLK